MRHPSIACITGHKQMTMKDIVTPNTHTPILTITGSDGTGEAGVQGDIKIMSALGGYAVSVITSITAQNTLGIQEFYDLPAEVVKGQMEAIVNDMRPEIVKIGMLRRVDVVRGIVEILRKHTPRAIIYDPVIKSSRGEMLMQQDVIDEIKKSLIPMCSLVVIRSRDVEYFTEHRSCTNNDIANAARQLFDCGCGNILLQDVTVSPGIHADQLIHGNNRETRYMSSLADVNSRRSIHGMSGVLSSAIAIFLGKSYSIEDAVMMAYNYINQNSTVHINLVGRSSELYNEFLNEVSEHAVNNNDVKYYADHLNVSSRYLAQVTKKTTGKTPKAIIDEHVCREACLQLTASSSTMQEIAYEFGFSSQAHFSKFFRKQTGLSPTEYRKKYNKTTL